MLPNQLSPHFSLQEMTRTDTGLPNVPTLEQGICLVRLCDQILEPMRELCGALHINSAFRSQAVNIKVGGARTSQHMLGQAADVVPAMGLQMAFVFVKASTIPFDQLILEPSWIHISCAPLGVTPRRQCLRAELTDQGMVYEAA